MKPRKGNVFNLLVMLSMLAGFVTTPAFAATASSPEPAAQTQTGLTPTIGQPVLPLDNSGVPPAPSAQPALDSQVDAKELLTGKSLSKGSQGNIESSADPLVQSSHGQVSMPAPSANWEGISSVGVGAGVYPPDTDGDVGPNHYVQIVNHFTFGSWVRVWNKTGVQVYDFGLSNLWPGGNVCNTDGSGDPIALYDQLADRWLLSQFALPNYPNGPFYECIAVSKTPNPTNLPADWWVYTFLASNTKMNDYPKLAVWPDAYYMTANLFAAGTGAWAGTGMWALDRAAMLSGAAAATVYFELPVSDWGGMLPADLDGASLPPAGTPNYMIEVHASEWPNVPPFTQDEVAVYEFDVDWATPANSTFTNVATLPMTPFNGDMCGFNRSCIPQPSTSQGLDAIADRAMFRLAYRNFGSYETMVSNITVDANGSDHAGIRWFELRKSVGTWSIQQEGTYSPDSAHRWMGSIAMDHVGNMALGYSVSSSSVYPSIRYAGRLAGDPLGQLPQAEAGIIAGTGSQTGSGSRWGDYSAMSVDPVDDCTFWYTQEYIQTTSGANWQTRVASFKFPNCSMGPSGTLSGYVRNASTLAPIGGASVTAVGPQTVSTTTAPDGSYSLNLPVGTYDGTASAFGYQPQTITGLSIISGTVTTQDFSLTPLNTFVVEGNVTDALTGSSGGLTPIVTEDFEVWPPAGWTIQNLGGNCVWNTNVFYSRPNYAGGVGMSADADSDRCGSGTTMNTALLSPVWDLSGVAVARLDFIASYNDIGAGGDTFLVDVSSDGGVTWTNLLTWDADHNPNGPGEAVNLLLTPYLSNQVRVRFQYLDGTWDWWAQVDQVKVMVVSLGWPLYASIDISGPGYPGSTVWTDPVSGYYSVTLPGSVAYTFDVNAFVPGYVPESRVVGPLTGNQTEDFALYADQVTCNAPGYNFTYAYSEPFEASDGGYTHSGVQDEWEWGAPVTWPSACGEGSYCWGTDLDGSYENGANNSLVSPLIDLSAYSAPLYAKWWQAWDIESATWDHAYAEVSINGGAYQIMWQHTGGTVQTDWTDFSYDISAAAGGTAQFRFRFTSDSSVTYNGYYVDFVRIPTGCTPQPGGLTVGNVYDANTLGALNDATVANPVSSATTVPTPADPAVADGFYTLFAPAGMHLYTASKSGGYQPANANVTVVVSDTVGQDFYLDAGWLSVKPVGLHAIVPLGQQSTLTTTLTNNGGAPVDWEVMEQDAGFNPAIGSGAPVLTRRGYFSPLVSNLPKPPGMKESDKPIPPRLVPPWTPIANYPSNIMDNTAEYFNGMLYSVGGYDGIARLASGYVYDPDSDSWSPIASMANARQKPAAAFINGKLYVTGGWDNSGTGSAVSALEIYNPATNSWSTGAPNPNPLAASAAVNLGGKMYVVGGCTTACGFDTVNVYDPASDSWSSAAPYPELTSWLACGAIAGKLYCAGGTASGESNSTYEYDPAANSWTSKADMLQTQWAMGYTSAGGKLWISGGVTDNFATVTNETFAYDPASDTWAPEANSNNLLYRGGSACSFYKVGGSSGGFTPAPNSEVYPGLTACGSGADVPWLSESPISGTLGVAAGPFSPLEQTTEMPVKPVEGAAQEVVGAAVPAEIPVPSEIGLASNPFVPTAVLFDNGPLVTHPGGGAGGVDASAVQTALAMTVFGYSHAPATIYRVADDFTVTGAGWQVDQITFFAYQTGSSTSSTINHLNLRIWVGQPGTPGSYVLWGDTTTNRLVNTAWSNIYRVTDAGLTNTLRPVMANTAAVGTFLTPGTYWLDWQTGGTLASGPFAPPVSVLGQTTTGNGLQSSGPGVWNPLVDVGPQGLPFIIVGSTPSASQVVDVTFDASVPEVNQPGDYFAKLRLTNDTPYGAPTVNVTMTVTAPPSFGKLNGTVTGLGYCDLNPAPLEGAQVVIQGGLNTYTVTTDANGYYQWWLDAANNPLNVTVTAAEHQEGNATVQLTAGMTTTQNFDLRWLQPCVDVAPTSLDVTVAQGYTARETLDILNTGVAPSGFAVSEMPSSLGATLGTSLPGSDAATNRTPVLEKMVDEDTIALPLANIIQDGSFEAGTPNPYWTEFSTNFGTPICDVAGCGTGGGTAGPRTGSFWAWFGGTSAYERGDLQQTLVIPFGSASLHFWLWIGTTGGPVQNYINVQIDGNEIFRVTADQQPLYPSFTEVVLDISSYADGNSHIVEFESEIFGTNTNFNLDDVMLDSAPNLEVPWLRESPITGTVPADSSAPIDVTFDSMTYTVGTYTAFLKVANDDLFNDPIMVPVTMTVVPPAYGVAAALVDDSLSGLPGETVTYTLIVTSTSNGPVDTFDITVSGETWTTTVPATVGPLDPDQSAMVDVTVNIPASAAGGDQDAATCTVTSQGDPTQSAQATMTTSAAAEFGVEVSPDMAQAGGAGETVTYMVTVTNTGNSAETFAVSVSGETWTTTVPATVGPLGSGEITTVAVTVDIPAGASVGDQDLATVAVTSQGDPTVFADVMLTTTVVSRGVFLPLVMNGYTP